MTQQHAPSFTLGDVEITRFVDWQGPFAPAAGLLPGIPREEWERNADWLAPEHWDPSGDLAVMALQAWVLRSEGRTIIVDTGMGAEHERPSNPGFDRWQSELLPALGRIGISPDDVDIVINTHLHVDHVSGNTVQSDGEWVPAFPRAQYLVPELDDAHFGPRNESGAGLQGDDRLIYDDSIRPVHDAGLSTLWSGSYRIDQNLTLESAPGHTPGSSVLRLASGQDRAVFAGDIIHSPLQVLHPHCSSTACLDHHQAAMTRAAILERAAAERELLIPAHFAGAGAVEVRRVDGELRLGRWATGG